MQKSYATIQTELKELLKEKETSDKSRFKTTASIDFYLYVNL